MAARSNRRDRPVSQNTHETPLRSGGKIDKHQDLSLAPAVSGPLRVSVPSDRSELEADLIARRVLAMSGPTPLGSVVEDDVVSRCPGDCDEVIHRSDGFGHAHGGVSQSDIAGLGSGRPLANSVRGFFEPRFGADLSQVRVHTGSGADRLASRVGARAFTYHQDVVFRSGEFRPSSGEGRRLLAHEFAHAVQQKGEVEPRVARQSFGEKWDAFWGAGPVDAHRASELAKEAQEAARQTGLPGLHNGPADAWRHCYWNCRMKAVIGEEDAADIAEIHEQHGKNPTAERMMDTWNNEEGRKCGGSCDSCCQSKLDAGRLWVLYGGKVGASMPTKRTGHPTGQKYESY